MFSINLIFVDAKTIRRLDEKYRKKDKVATVLSFYYSAPTEVRRTKGGGQGRQIADCLGEIVICLSETKKQNLTIEDLVIHGLRNLLSQIPTAKLK